MLNIAVVIGDLVKVPQIKTLPSGATLASFDLLVHRVDRTADSVPIALFDATDQVGGWTPGQQIMAIGRVRRRFFRVGGLVQSRTEVVAEHVSPIGAVGRARDALVSAGDTLASVLEDIRSAAS